MTDPSLPSAVERRAPSSEISFIEPGPDSDDEFLPRQQQSETRHAVEGNGDAAGGANHALLNYTLKRRRNRLFSTSTDGDALSNSARRVSRDVETAAQSELDALLAPTSTPSPSPNDHCLQLRRLRPLTLLLGGPLCAVASVAFAQLCDSAWDVGRRTFLPYNNSPWLLLVLPLAYGFVLKVIDLGNVRGARSGGVVQCILALASLGLETETAGNGNEITAQQQQQQQQHAPPPAPPAQLDPRTTVAKFLLTPLTLLFLAPAGREGPTVQLCAGVMWILGSISRWSVEERRGGVLAGGAGGLASAFGTGLGGVVFAVEELGHVFDSSVSGLILVTVALSGLVTSVLPSGEYEYFSFIKSPYPSHSQLFPLIATSFICGLLGGLMAKLVTRTASFLSRSDYSLFKLFRSRPWTLGLVVGLLIAALGQFPGHAVFGAGYEIARDMVLDVQREHGQPALDDLWIAYSTAPLKFCGMFLFAVSGLPGGLFSPSLSIGIALGYMLSRNLVGLASPLAVLLVGTSAYFGGVTQGPLTAFVVVRDIFGLDSSWILPLLSSSILGSWASSLVQSRPMYERLAEISLGAV